MVSAMRVSLFLTNCCICGNTCPTPGLCPSPLAPGQKSSHEKEMGRARAGYTSLEATAEGKDQFLSQTSRVRAGCILNSSLCRGMYDACKPAWNCLNQSNKYGEKDNSVRAFWIGKRSIYKCFQL